MTLCYMDTLCRPLSRSEVILSSDFKSLNVCHQHYDFMRNWRPMNCTHPLIRRSVQEHVSAPANETGATNLRTAHGHGECIAPC